MKFIHAMVFTPFLIGLAPALQAESSQLTAVALANICRGEQPYGKDTSPKLAETAAELKAYCHGYVEASTALFQSNEIVQYMPQGSCFDVAGGMMPQFEESVYESVKQYVAGKPEIKSDESPLRLIGKAVAKAYPCKSGKVAAGADDFRSYGVGGRE